VPRTIIAGNWKMYKTAAETRAFLDAFLPQTKSFPKGIDVVIAPPFTALAAAHEMLGSRSDVALGAQNVHWQPQGAFTGEISAPMLAEHGVTYVIVGHSERRAFFNELDRTVNLKVRTLLECGMTPIIAVGETHGEREDKMTDMRVVAQTREALDGVSDADIARVVIAYEPIWAIGTGENCDWNEANRVMGVIRACVPALADVPILYGGSMKADNVASYIAQPQINGGLVGGASLDPDGFATLIRNASFDQAQDDRTND
jgi:triosephosphate isomerase (TIM)